MLKIVVLIILFLFPGETESPNFPPPPGTIKSSGNFFIDRKPVTYLDYNEFLFHMKIQNPGNLNSLIPEDTTTTYRNEILWNNPKFQDFPVLGLSLDQIQMYCNWRSEMVNQLIKNPGLRCSNFKYWEKFDILDSDRKYELHYFIPSIADNPDFCRKIRKQRFDELTTDGRCTFKGGKMRNKTSPGDLYSFRCVAEYSLIQD